MQFLVRIRMPFPHVVEQEPHANQLAQDPCTSYENEHIIKNVISVAFYIGSTATENIINIPFFLYVHDCLFDINPGS